MPDIHLRFHHDMLVLSAPIDAVLARQGVDAALDRQFLNLMEPDQVQDALKLELAAGAHCLVTTTEDITRARLAHVRMDGDAARLAGSALDIANALRPQHVLAEIGPCGLPLDASSKASLNENRNQYADAARAFGDGAFDAFFLNGFTAMADLKCALMGVAQVSGKPVFASVTIGEGGAPLPAATFAKPVSAGNGIDDIGDTLPFFGYEAPAASIAPPVPAALRTTLDAQLWPEAIETMADLGAAVIGFETADPIDCAVRYAGEAVTRTDLPVLAQLRVGTPDDKKNRGLVPLESIDDYTPDTMARAAVKLFGAGVQFLRATGVATPAFTGALAATVQGLDVLRGKGD